jgi:hypothetical protein
LSLDEEPRHIDAGPWRTVRSGLGLVQIGYVVTFISLVLLLFAAGAQPAMPENYYNNLAPHRTMLFGLWPLSDLLCGGGCGLLIGAIVMIVGQALTTAVPQGPLRSAALTSLILTLFGLVVYLFQVLLATNARSFGTYLPGRRYGTDWLPGLLGGGLLIVAHVVFIYFLRRVAQYFWDLPTRRHATYYLVFYCLYLGLGLFLLVVSLSGAGSTSPYSSKYYSPSAAQLLLGVGGTVFGCFGLILAVALFSLVGRIGSLIRTRLLLDRGGPPAREW